MRKNTSLLTLTFALLCIIIMLSACASKKKQPPPSVINGFPSTTDDNSKISQIRLEALQETAATTATQTGLSWQSDRIDQFLEEDERVLSKAFNFQALILEHDVLPPVLVEGRNALNLDNPDAIRLADHTYKIEAPPRFVTAAPTWREYLWMDYPRPERPHITLLPRDDNERRIWNEAAEKGWEEGIQQANQIFSANMGRLKRDFNGMVLYRKLLAQQMVTAPFVAKTELGVTGDENEMRVNDQILRITATSKLVPDSKKWKAIATPGYEGAWKTQGTQGTKTLE